MANMDYMKAQQTFLDDTKKKIKGKPNWNTVGLNIISYEFIHEPSKTLFSGTVSFEDGKKKGVRFLISEETRAKKISAASYLENVAILKLWFATYCEFIDKWLLCYDQFDYLLGDWLLKERGKETMEQRMRDGDDLLHLQGSELIRSLLKAIIYIHTQGLFHTGLNITSNYVVLSNKVKIINIGVKSLEDLPMPIDDATVNGLRMADLTEFKDLLKMHILKTKAAWSDRDLFFSFFDLTTKVSYNTFIVKLIGHPFLMRYDDERMMSFFEIVSYTSDSYKFNKRREFIRTLESKSFEQYLDWDKNMGVSLRSVYEYEDEKVKRRNYDGQSITQLLEFLRNAYRHPGENSMAKLDKDVRDAYSGFLHRVYEVLCRVEATSS